MTTKFTLTELRTFKGNAAVYHCFLLEADGVSLGELSVPAPFVDDLRRRLTSADPVIVTASKRDKPRTRDLIEAEIEECANLGDAQTAMRALVRRLGLLESEGT